MKVYFNKYFLSARYFNSQSIKDNYDCESIDVIKNSFFSRLMNIHLKKINTLFKCFVFFMPSTYFRKNNDALFLFSIANLFDIFSAVHKTQSKHITVWLWNPLRMTFSKRILFAYLHLLGARVITFDQQDAEKYDLIFHPQVYNPEILKTLKQSNNNFDLFFVGADKYRYRDLSEFAKRLTKLSLSFCFNIVSDKTTKDTQAQYISHQYIDYDEYLSLLNQSLCLLDFTQEKQTGLTVRVVEAIFAGKKIVTNNKDVLNYDIYNPENFFVMGVDDEALLELFLRSPFKTYSEDILYQYQLISLLELAKQPEVNHNKPLV